MARESGCLVTYQGLALHFVWYQELQGLLSSACVYQLRVSARLHAERMRGTGSSISAYHHVPVVTIYEAG